MTLPCKLVLYAIFARVCYCTTKLTAVICPGFQKTPSYGFVKINMTVLYYLVSGYYLRQGGSGGKGGDIEIECKLGGRISVHSFRGGGAKSECTDT